MPGSFYETKSQSRERERQEERVRQITSDMAALLSMGEGKRFFTGYLKKLGLGQTLECEPGQVASLNHGIELLREITSVNSQAAAEIVVAVFGMDPDEIVKEKPNARE